MGEISVLSTQIRFLCYQGLGGFIAVGSVQLRWRGLWANPLWRVGLISEESIETLVDQIPKEPYPGLVAVNQTSDIT